MPFCLDIDFLNLYDWSHFSTVPIPMGGGDITLKKNALEASFIETEVQVYTNILFVDTRK